jgi:hypothetical protein
LVTGPVAGLVAVGVHGWDPAAEVLVCGLAVLCALHGYLLAFIQLAARGRAVAAGLAGFGIGLAGAWAVAWSRASAAGALGDLEQLLRPLVLLGLCALSGAAPLGIPLFSRPRAYRDALIRFMLGGFSGFLALLIGLLVVGISSSLMDPSWEPAMQVLAFGLGGALLFWLQSLTLGPAPGQEPPGTIR